MIPAMCELLQYWVLTCRSSSARRVCSYTDHNERAKCGQRERLTDRRLVYGSVEGTVNVLLNFSTLLRLGPGVQ